MKKKKLLTIEELEELKIKMFSLKEECSKCITNKDFNSLVKYATELKKIERKLKNHLRKVNGVDK